MNVKTLTGSSISALLAEARQLFGDDVVLLESVPAQGDQHARITVMVDRRLPARQPHAEPQPAREGAPSPTYRQKVIVRPEPALVDVREAVEAGGGAAPPAAGYGYPAARPVPEDAARAGEGFSRARTLAEGSARKRRTGRGSLFPAETAAPARRPVEATSWKPLGDLFTTRIERLEKRLEAFENLFGHAFIGASQPWMAHPLYGLLLKQGLRTRTLTRLFNRLAEMGFAPDDDPSRVQWALATELRSMLDVTQPKTCAGAQLFIGASGAGKTALQLKLARHPRFLGRRKTTILVIEPEKEEAVSHHCPVELYRKFDLSVQTVRRPEEMRAALDRARRFSHILIDTPPLPLQPQAAHAALLRLQYMTEAVAPLQIHLVLDATRVLDAFDARYLERMPLRPDTLAFTHLDEAEGLGRVAECVMELGLPVQFVSNGMRVPDDVGSFSPSRLVEALLNMSIVSKSRSLAWSML
jgi:flagellar biosynthesis protein FlhF